MLKWANKDLGIQGYIFWWWFWGSKWIVKKLLHFYEIYQPSKKGHTNFGTSRSLEPWSLWSHCNEENTVKMIQTAFLGLQGLWRLSWWALCKSPFVIMSSTIIKEANLEIFIKIPQFCPKWEVNYQNCSWIFKLQKHFEVQYWRARTLSDLALQYWLQSAPI